MTKSNWICSADHDCSGPFASRRRPHDHDREHDAGLCLMHRCPAYRSLTVKQRKALGWSERESRAWVHAAGPDARAEAQELVDDHAKGGGDEEDDLDGLTEDDDLDGLYDDFMDGNLHESHPEQKSHLSAEETWHHILEGLVKP